MKDEDRITWAGHVGKNTGKDGIGPLGNRWELFKNWWGFREIWGVFWL